MDFLDRTGHIFSLQSYSSYPVGYEYQETPYIFWFNSDKSYKLSVDCWYFQSIRLLIPVEINDEINLNISLNSNKFYILGSKDIQEKLLSDEFKDINDRITLYSKEFKQELKYTGKFNIDNDNKLKIEESGDLLGCLVEKSTRQSYTKYYFTYNNGENIYSGIPELKNGKFYGKLKIGPLEQEIELDNIQSKTVLVTNEEIVNNTIYSGEYFNNGNLEKRSSSVITETSYYLILPFYCLAKSDEFGAFETNVLINYTYNNDDTLSEFCPITIGAEFIDEVEALIINGKNMGVNLPKEILKAVYSGNYFSSTPDETLYSQKLKEFLLNYMNIRGERGNYKSVINSLKWFEWGDLLTINKLYKRDVDIQNQYVRDYFDIINDTIYSYQLFMNTTLISLSFKLNHESFDEQGNIIREFQDFNNFFAGEGKPILTENLSTLKEKRYDEKDIPFYRGYYDYTFTELGLKLCALKYYYEKYFLPIHIKIHSASLSHQVWMNDIKFFARTNNYITEVPVYNGYYNSFLNFDDSTIHESKDIKVIFNYPNAVNNDVIYINHIIDTLDPEKDRAQLELNYNNYLINYNGPDKVSSFEDYIKQEKWINYNEQDTDNNIKSNTKSSKKVNLKDFYYFDSDYNCFSNTKELATTYEYHNKNEYLDIEISIEDNSVIISKNIDNIISINNKNIIINNNTDKKIKYILKGNFKTYYFTVNSNTEPYIVLNNCIFSNSSKNIINLKTNKTTYIELIGLTIFGNPSNFIKKGISSKGDLVLFNNGTINICSYDNCIDSDNEIRIYDGIYILTHAASHSDSPTSKNCISALNVIIYNANITANVTGVCSSDNFKASSCIKGDNNFTIYDGQLSLIAYGNGDKCINFDNDAFFYGGTINCKSEGITIYNYEFTDKKTPKAIKIGGNVLINGSNIISKSTGSNNTLAQDVETEAFECKGTLIMYSGTLACQCYENKVSSEDQDTNKKDGLNIGGDLYLYGGGIYAIASDGDAIDINKDFYLKGGIVIGISESTLSGNDGIDVEFEPIDEHNNPRENRCFIKVGDRNKHYGTLFDFRSSWTNPVVNYDEKYFVSSDYANINNTNSIFNNDDYILEEGVYYLFDNTLAKFIFKPKVITNISNYSKKYVFTSSYNTTIYKLNNVDESLIFRYKIFDNGTVDFYLNIDENIINVLNKELFWEKDNTEYFEDISYSYENPPYNDIELEKLEYIPSQEEIDNNNYVGYYIDDTALFIPINIICPNGQYLDIHLELWKEDNSSPIHISNFKFVQSTNKRYKGLVVYPKELNKNFDINYWENKKFELKLLINGNYFEYSFIAKLPEINIGMGKLIYDYNEQFKQIKSLTEDSIEFNSYMHSPSLVTVNNLDWEKEIVQFQNNLTDYVNKYYSGKINTIDKYLNYCYLIDIFDTNGNYIPVNREEAGEYTDIWNYINSINGYSDSEKLVQNLELYNQFFTNEGNIKDSIIENMSKNNLSISFIKENYDFYLMHDFERWYLICISKKVSENINNPLIINPTFKGGEYNFRFVKADKKLLINRFKFIEEEGVNHFNSDDLLAFYLRCNDKLKFKVTYGTKWKINQISIKNPISESVESNSELAIVSLQNNRNRLAKGYYNISVFYSIDDYSQHTFEAKGKFRID